ncbi:hypothetical protein N665_0088s0050 [Sinapis alba]|nr:hypothetical protein N665_3590s0001 [Sinapis alba]KAF8051057.1 hypothetical protein N665_1811s0004 [Sinapis alba]KAF8089606.1 hypothetical protein N665_0501s0018 [Sinapis alba]KAF8092171.1 hypothetical protein N665_0422s0007 [Sinapis alba]KAF8110036.1 hypothetical protein N665_0088s0050 [Sinapis alba]
MGQDYSYSQPSSSEEYNIGFACLLQGEADAYRDEAESSLCIAEPVHYPPQPECDDGIPKICYCGGEAVLATSYTSKDPGRRYFTCRNVDDGECHIWKWYDVAVMEELSEFGRQLREVKDQCYVADEKLVTVAKRVCDLASKKEAGCRSVSVVGSCILVLLVVVVAVWW